MTGDVRKGANKRQTATVSAAGIQVLIEDRVWFKARLRPVLAPRRWGKLK